MVIGQARHNGGPSLIEAPHEFGLLARIGRHIGTWATTYRIRVTRPGAAVLLALASTAACGAPPEPVVLDLSSARDRIEYPSETIALRAQDHLATELVQRYGGSSSTGLLYRPTYLHVDGEGSVFVLDDGHKRLIVFDASGDVIAQLGREGQGPGEFQQPRGVTTSGGSAFALVHHSRLAIWGPAGELIRDVRLPTNRPHRTLEAFGDGTLVTSYHVSPDSPDDLVDSYIPEVIVGYDTGGALRAEYVRTPSLFRVSGITGYGPRPSSVWTVDPAGRIYVSDGATYDILAIDADGTRPWHLRVNVDPPAWTEDDTDFVMAGLRVPANRNELQWPEALPQLAGLKVDGHGHLWVYRYMRPDKVRGRRIVDIFSRDGEHLFSGTTDDIRWRVGRGDRVYAVLDDEASGGRVIGAFRLVESF